MPTADQLSEIRAAAERGDADAQSTLGWMYREDQGVKQDDAQALFWYRKAAEQGDDDAKKALEQMNERDRSDSKR